MCSKIHRLFFPALLKKFTYYHFFILIDYQLFLYYSYGLYFSGTQEIHTWNR